eukprot:4375925-Pleurochrysis_carterae.AAC.2
MHAVTRRSPRADTAGAPAASAAREVGTHARSKQFCVAYLNRPDDPEGQQLLPARRTQVLDDVGTCRRSKGDVPTEGGSEVQRAACAERRADGDLELVGLGVVLALPAVPSQLGVHEGHVAVEEVGKGEHGHRAHPRPLVEREPVDRSDGRCGRRRVLQPRGVQTCEWPRKVEGGGRGTQEDGSGTRKDARLIRREAAERIRE